MLTKCKTTSRYLSICNEPYCLRLHTTVIVEGNTKLGLSQISDFEL